jgi:hypothetical protein
MAESNSFFIGPTPWAYAKAFKEDRRRFPCPQEILPISHKKAAGRDIFATSCSSFPTHRIDACNHEWRQVLFYRIKETTSPGSRMAGPGFVWSQAF